MLLYYNICIYAIITTEYEDDITVDDAITLVCTAISAGNDNDLGSGSNVDICIITKDSTKYNRAFKRNVFSNNAAVHHKHVPHNVTRAKNASADATNPAIGESSSVSSASSSATDHTISSIDRQQQQQSDWFNKEVVRPSIVTLHTSAAGSGSSRKVTDDSIELL
jgi:Proteasome subunit